MKNSFIYAAASAMLLSAWPAGAQTVVRETTATVQPVEVAGTVTELAPEAVVIRTQEAAAPVRYAFTKTTEYVDEAGNRVSREVVKTGVPVTIRYIKNGDEMTVSRVIVHPAAVTAPEAVTTEKTTTTTTTTEGRREKDERKHHDKDKDKDKD